MKNKVTKLFSRLILRRNQSNKTDSPPVNIANNGSTIVNGTYTNNYYGSSDGSKINSDTKNNNSNKNYKRGSKSTKTIALVFVPLIIMALLTVICVINEPSECKSLLNFWHEIFNDLLNFTSASLLM